jgi:hypothetical protein
MEYNEEQCKQWFEIVKGKPIRWTSWESEGYNDHAVVPIELDGLKFKYDILGTCEPLQVRQEDDRYFYIYAGFEPTPNNWYIDIRFNTKLGKLYYERK